jgi:hypothetical protein
MALSWLQCERQDVERVVQMTRISPREGARRIHPGGEIAEEERLLPRSRRAGAGAKGDEGREKPKRFLPPRFGGRSGDKAAPDEPGPEWMD